MTSLFCFSLLSQIFISIRYWILWKFSLFSLIIIWSRVNLKVQKFLEYSVHCVHVPFHSCSLEMSWRLAVLSEARNVYLQQVSFLLCKSFLKQERVSFHVIVNGRIRTKLNLLAISRIVIRRFASIDTFVSFSPASSGLSKRRAPSISKLPKWNFPEPVLALAFCPRIFSIHVA